MFLISENTSWNILLLFFHLLTVNNFTKIIFLSFRNQYIII